MNSRLIRETAEAWELPVKDVENIAWWVGAKVPRHKQSNVFVMLLRRKRSGVKV